MHRPKGASAEMPSIVWITSSFISEIYTNNFCFNEKQIFWNNKILNVLPLTMFSCGLVQSQNEITNNVDNLSDRHDVLFNSFFGRWILCDIISNSYIVRNKLDLLFNNYVQVRTNTLGKDIISFIPPGYGLNRTTNFFFYKDGVVIK